MVIERRISPYQGTIAKSLKFAGVGLHSGKVVEIEIHPARPNFGINFQRSDQKLAKVIRANSENVTDSRLCTTLGSGPSQVSTIEHLMAAFSGLGVDNALVLINANEVPILDGSAAPFVDQLQEAGIQLSKIPRPLFRLEEPFEVAFEDSYVRYEPTSFTDDQLFMKCSIDFARSKAIAFQSIELEFTNSSFLDICEARTFCHIEDVEKMRSLGLARGGSLDNAVVVNHESVVNNEGLRYPDEFVRHKLLDLIGDLALLEGRLVGKITAHKAGHHLHTLFTRKLLSLQKPAQESKEQDFSLAASAHNL